MSDVYVVSGCRTPIGSFLGQFENHSATELGTICITEALARAQIQPENVDQVIIGQVLTAGHGQNPARQSAVGAKIPYTTPAFTINLLCGSGLKSVLLAYQAIRNGDCDIVVAGGQENMTQAQHTVYARGCKLGGLDLKDSLLTDGLTDAFHKVHMGNTTEYLVNKYNISRQAQDEFAAVSQNKTEAAIKNGYFVKEIVPVLDKKLGAIIKDEYPKFGTTVEALSKLPPRFEANGTVTSGNASGINDGAAAVVVCSAKAVAEKKLKPLAKIVGFAEAGVEPMCMGIGPINAVKKLLSKIGWTHDDVDLYELNEAYAAQSIIVGEELGVDMNKVNLAGGALSLGHPLGCSGTRIFVTLIYNLQRLGKKKGVASLCIGGGMGIAAAIELVN